MTQEEINKKHAEQLEFNTVTDYTKWSFERRQRGLSTDHDLWKKERDYAQLERHMSNNEAQRKHLAGLQEKRDAEERAIERAIDAEIEPQKQRLKRDWLANNPTFSESDFESKAWIHLRQNLLEDREANAANAEIKRQLSTGRY
jgi:hypothetical protein